MYNSIEYNDAYSKTLGSLQQYYRDELALDGKSSITDFPAKVTNRSSFKFKQQITVQTENCGTRDVAVMVQLKDLRNFWKTLEMPLIDCEITFQWTCSKKSIPVAGTAANQVPKYIITNIKLYVPAVTLSTQENIKLIKQLESDFKRTINWNKYHSEKISQAQNRYLVILIDQSFHGVLSSFN